MPGITNAKLVSYTTPPTPNGRGGETAGTNGPLKAKVCVDKPKRSQLESRGDLTADATAVVYAPPSSIYAVRGLLTFRVDGESADQTLEVVSVDGRSHGHQSHVEILLRQPR